MQSLIKDKINTAILRIKMAYEVAQNVGNTLVCAYSGGKDSDALLNLCLDSGVDFRAEHNHTTVDAPQTVYRIREVFADLKSQGVPAKINYPAMLKDTSGKTVRASMWNLIPVAKIPPRRDIRYCCEHFKERYFENQHLLTGVRWSESNARKSHAVHENQPLKKEKKRVLFAAKLNDETVSEQFSLEEIGAELELDSRQFEGVSLDENNVKRRLSEMCNLRGRMVTNPIIDWTDSDVFLYLKYKAVKLNPLYKYFPRIGCIGCPKGGCKQQRKQFEMFPKYYNAYIKSFDRLAKVRKERGLSPLGGASDGQGIMDWWLKF